ncbi:hypothetical protein MPH_04071 [Macrophomina phaseolina MS6]|uniref:Uncharacterized protein n=1 Tax=Macrophomina phaseolina (strain MS6) TaxID=1126212 RepID=K2R8D3_MACPH|nr:hypothetical protein MPH_04071 [Macrophomina phaseolina MS6]
MASLQAFCFDFRSSGWPCYERATDLRPNARALDEAFLVANNSTAQRTTRSNFLLPSNPPQRPNKAFQLTLFLSRLQWLPRSPHALHSARLCIDPYRAGAQPVPSHFFLPAPLSLSLSLSLPSFLRTGPHSLQQENHPGTGPLLAIARIR